MRPVEFADKDLPLREDVSALGALVGEMLVEQAGEDFFAHVERLRTAAISRREAAGGTEELSKQLAELDVTTAERLVRAFGTYFRVVNLAERVHRIRRRRHYLRADGAPQRASLSDVIGELKSKNHDFEAIWTAIGELQVQPVFTAHPTETTRRTILEKEQDIVRRLVENLNPDLTPPERRTIMARIRAAITSGWQTQLHPHERPTVSAEMEHVLFYLTDVLYRIIPPFYEHLREAMVDHFDIDGEALRMPVMLRFGSWVGGDMDGNPNVDADSIRATLAEHRRLIVKSYLPEVRRLARYLSQTTTHIPVTDAVEHRIKKYQTMLPKVAETIPARHINMPYRTLLRLMTSRLTGALTGKDTAYGSGAELVSDLQLIRSSMEQNKGDHAGLYLLRRTQLRARTFGFHLATLDVRQDSDVLRRVVGLLLEDSQWRKRAAVNRTAKLTELLGGEQWPELASNNTTEQTVEVFRAIKEGKRDYGSHAVGLFIISMTQGADDVMSALMLAREAGLADTNRDGQTHVPLDISPLLETVDDLRAGPRILQELFANPVYREHLTARSNRQVVMIGYSDSNKDSGIAASRWALHQAERDLTAKGKEHGVEVVFFHGRGGTVSRGGGNTRDGILGAPAGTVQGYLRVTEQGETINQKYGVRAIALRNLEIASGAALLHSLDATPVDGDQASQQIMAEIAGRSREVFRGLVYETPKFIDYFRQATPIDVIENLAIGSRPASRRSQKGIENLRAIPWVFSWAQTRTGFPGVFGVGTALSEALQAHGREQLKSMVDQWTFFRALVNDVEMVLAKSDLQISRSYSELADPQCRDVYQLIADELNLAAETILAIKGSDELLADQATLSRSIWLRNPYVDPMNLLQIDLLQRWRETDRKDDDLLQALFATVNGIAQGIQNTG